MKNVKKYWKGLAELNEDPIVDKLRDNEFVDEIPVDEFLGSEEVGNNITTRRDFLKFLGFSTAAATLAACEAPVNKVIPYVVKPEEIIPGIANYYATTIYDGHDYASVLVKTREGRPIKIEKNNTCVNARSQASVLSLYDSGRLQSPLHNNQNISWEELDSDIVSRLQNISDSGGNIAVLTSTIISPTTQALINNFLNEYGNGTHVQMDAISYSGILDANEESFGVRALPSYHFDKADLIISFGADFLANWTGIDASSKYIAGRDPKSGKMSKHYQIESTLSLTGSNADERVQIKPSQQKQWIEDLYFGLDNLENVKNDKVRELVLLLKEGKKSSIIICNSNDKDVQVMVNAINYKLGNYDLTIDIKSPIYLRKGNDQDLLQLVEDMNNGMIDALITYNVNPSYTLFDSEKFNAGLKKVKLKVSHSLYMDETAINMDYVCAESHNLESWGDANPSHTQYSLMQPTISKLFSTRQFQESLMSWTNNKISYYDYLKNFYSKDINWDEKLHDGYFTKKDVLLGLKSIPSFLLNNRDVDRINSDGIEFEIYEKIAMGNGSQSNNPWLQELPDPISRACWDNYLTISTNTAKRLGIENWNVANGGLNGSLVNITVEGKSLNNVPALISPGQADDTVSMAVGYGRTHAGKCGTGIGKNCYSLLNGGKADIVLAEGVHEFASIQLHHTMMGRDLVKETTLQEYIKNPKSGNYRDKYYTHEGKKTADQVTLWDQHDHKTGHLWNLSIDLTKCIGCAACVISCHAENNVPVVGKEEMRKSRDMHWLRIDRYFSSDMSKDIAKKDEISSIEMYQEMEDPSSNPEVVFQPVMCQHCNQAPCETVCPVAATSHSEEGLNHMAYNRCVGTRYCANNCPYKVRRFNWFQYSDNDQFDYNMNDDYGKMVLNPDVVVRSRGVMEKCSMCIQKIQELKLTAKREGRKISESEAQTACSSACDTDALVFGDVNDPDHTVHDLRKDERAYDLLDHLNVRPSVFYQTKIRNKS